jgi:hypothetical protein
LNSYGKLAAVVTDVIHETPDTRTLVLSIVGERLEYQAGQFLLIDPHQFKTLQRFVTFFEALKGRKEPPRAYSLSSAPHEPYIAFTVKEEPYVSESMKYPPLLSPFLVSEVPSGTRLMIIGFAGAYTLNSKILGETNHLFHIPGGSGIVPNLSGSLEIGTYTHAGKGRFAVLFERVIGSYRNRYSEGTDSTRPELSLLPVRPRAFSGVNHHDSEGAWCVAESNHTRIVWIIAVKLKRLLCFPMVPVA